MPASPTNPVRVAPVTKPYPESVSVLFDAITPKLHEPLLLFRTLARAPRVYQRMHAGGLLDQGALSLRQRELIILRTCALHGCEYEWGVHVAVFAKRAGLTRGELRATVDGDDRCFDAAERVMLQAIGEVDQTTRLKDDTWRRLAAYFQPEQILEILAVTGFYRTICTYANALLLPAESFAARFQEVLEPSAIADDERLSRT